MLWENGAPPEDYRMDQKIVSELKVQDIDPLRIDGSVIKVRLVSRAASLISSCLQVHRMRIKGTTYESICTAVRCMCVPVSRQWPDHHICADGSQPVPNIYFSNPLFVRESQKSFLT